MSPAMQGALVGLVLAVVLVGYEYLAVKKQVEERAAARHKRPEFEPMDKIRIWSVVRFGIFLPPGGAVLFWLWNMMG